MVADSCKSCYPGRMTIYFIRKGEAGPIKIGYTASADPSKRMRQLQTGQEDRLILLGSIDGTIDDEQSLHKEFAYYRLEGEWFRSASELVKTVQYLIEEKKPWYHARQIRQHRVSLELAHEWWRPIFCREECSSVKDEPKHAEGTFSGHLAMMERLLAKGVPWKDIRYQVIKAAKEETLAGPRYRAVWEGHWPLNRLVHEQEKQEIPVFAQKIMSRLHRKAMRNAKLAG